MHAHVYVLFVLQSVFKILFYIPYCRYIMAKEVNLQRAHIDTSVFLNQYQIALHTNEGKFSDNWFSVQLALLVYKIYVPCTSPSQAFTLYLLVDKVSEPLSLG
jgi:hypothetical protein